MIGIVSGSELMQALPLYFGTGTIDGDEEGGALELETLNLELETWNLELGTLNLELCARLCRFHEGVGRLKEL